jgi:hypothetical protein
VDARVELGQYLGIGCNGNANQATYMVLSVPGVARTAQPIGPTQLDIEAILAAQRNGAGVSPGMSYSAVNTPWGYGYLGTPSPFNSGAYNSMGGVQSQSPYISQSPYAYQGTQGSVSAGNTGGTTSGTGSASQGAGVASILAQPAIAQRGRTIIVSWTSVNMAPNSCTVSVGGQQFDIGEHGSKPFRTVSSDPSNLRFVFRCTDTSGAVSEVSSTVSLQ